MIGRGSGRRTHVAELDSGAKLAISRSGRFLIDGKLGADEPGYAGDARVLDRAARLAAGAGLFAKLRINSDMRGRVVGQLSEAIEHAQSGKRTKSKDRAFCASMALMIDLAKNVPKSDGTVRRAVLDRLLQALHAEPDVEQVGFYVRAMRPLFKNLDKVQRAALKAVLTRIMPKRPLVEAYTEGRTKPLEIRHMIHPEFWKEELGYFSKKNGFKLLKKNAKDTRREYQGLIKDPRGMKKPLKVHMVIEKGELDFLEGMSDPKAHVIMYSGHSALGGNGSQAVADAGAMKGEHPKLVFIANCRGKDNYAAFTNKYPTAHCIMTEHPTYGHSGQDRIEGLFDTLVRGNTYRYMRSITEYEWWDEPADNYFYPDEWRKFGFMDADNDGKIDSSKLGGDILFDVDLRDEDGKFVRAVNFANSELFYHWEVEHENGKKSFYGREYGDSLVPDGLLRDAKPGELVRVTPASRKLKNGKTGTRYRVRFAPKQLEGTDENQYAALVTMHTVMALAKEKTGKLDKREVLRAMLMGAQAIHYLDVYVDSAPETMRRYFDELGIASNVDAHDVDEIFESHDAHANAAQVKAFEQMLETKYGVDLDAWYQDFAAKLA